MRSKDAGGDFCLRFISILFVLSTLLKPGSETQKALALMEEMQEAARDLSESSVAELLLGMYILTAPAFSGKLRPRH